MLPGMDASASVRGISQGRWGLARARKAARAVEASRRGVRELVAAVFGESVEERKRAADVLRRITERSAAPLSGYAEELMGLVGEIPAEESRTRWHMWLVAARVAHTREQRLRAARLMELLMVDQSNVVRCSAVEGIALLARGESSLRGLADEMIERALREGTPAERCRAKKAAVTLERAWNGRGR